MRRLSRYLVVLLLALGLGLPAAAHNWGTHNRCVEHPVNWIYYGNHRHNANGLQPSQPYTAENVYSWVSYPPQWVFVHKHYIYCPGYNE